MFNKRVFSVVLAGLLVGLLVTALSGVALAQAPLAQTPLAQTPLAQTPRVQKVSRIARLKTHLALTDKQVSDIEDLLKKHQTAAFPIRQDLRARNQELRSALDTAEPSSAAVGQLVIVQRSLRSQMRTLNLKLQGDIAAKLTPEQQLKFAQLKSRIGSRARRG